MPKPLQDGGINFLFMVFIQLPLFFSVCSVYAPTYVGLVGSVINTLITVVCIPSQTKPESDHHRTEDSEYSVFLINST